MWSSLLRVLFRPRFVDRERAPCEDEGDGEDVRERVRVASMSSEIVGEGSRPRDSDVRRECAVGVVERSGERARSLEDGRCDCEAHEDGEGEGPCNGADGRNILVKR